MKLRRRSSIDDEDSAINVSPLIDVVFILLIFFIVSATFISLPGVDVSRPKVQNASSLQKNSVLFALSEKSEIFHSGEIVELSEVSPLIRLAIKDKDKPVVIQVDKWADATVLTKLVLEAKKVARSVSLATLKNR
ncbi:biopolymer transporter ExbD [Opitutales bacterium]|jgi:biopolymer transport protein ExbD|nr:biopolymer transporter ExbD [Opitutales bacterium]